MHLITLHKASQTLQQSCSEGYSARDKVGPRQMHPLQAFFHIHTLHMCHQSLVRLYKDNRFLLLQPY